MPDTTKKREERQEDQLTAKAGLQAGKLAEVKARLDTSRQATEPQAAELKDKIAANFAWLRQEADKALQLAGPQATNEVHQLMTGMLEGQQREAASAFELEKKTLDRLVGAIEGVAKRQEDERTRAAGRPELTNGLAQRHADELEEVGNLVKSATDTLDSNMTKLRERQSTELSRVATAVVQGGDLLLKSMQELEAEQQEAVGRPAAKPNTFTQGETQRTAMRLSKVVEEQARALAERPSAEQVSRLRDRIGVVAKELDDKALERVFAEAAKGRTDQQRADAARGQLAEELNNLKAQEWVRQQNDPSLRFVRGDLIRDGLGNKLTDGVLLREHDGRRDVIKAWEMKSGVGSADNLKRILRTDRSNEVNAQARDLAIKELADEARVKEGLYQNLQAAQDARGRLDDEDALDQQTELEKDDVRRFRAILDTDEVDKRIEEKLRTLQSRSNQTEAGQQEMTAERLSMQRMFLDGAEIDLPDPGERRRTEVRAVLPRDVEPNLDADRLDQTEAELRAAADIVVDERRKAP